jgi:hypothetical protein
MKGLINTNIDSNIASKISNNNISTNKRQTLSEEVKCKLAEITTQIENRHQSFRNSRFIKFKDGEHKLLSLIANKVQIVTVTYPNAPDKPVQRYKFYVHDLTTTASSSGLNSTTITTTTNNNNVPLNEEEQEWTVNATVARELIRWLSKGYFIMNITRHGTDLKTTYDIEPLID